MLTIKKGGLTLSFFLSALIAIFFLSGCSESGPHALFEGERLINEGKYDQAIAKLQKAVELLPKTAQAWNHLGLAYHNAGNASEAVKAYKRALELDRNLATVHFNLGCLYLEQTNYTAASASLTTYTAWDSHNNRALLKLGVAQVRAAMQLPTAEKNKALDVARKTFEASLNMEPTAEAFNGLGMIEAQRGRQRDAIKYFNNALQKDPAYSPAMLNLAIVYQQLNDSRAALQRYREFLASQPRSNRHKEIEDIARQLDSDLNPTVAATPVPPPPTNKPAPAPAKVPLPKEKAETAPPPGKAAEMLVAKPAAPPPVTIPPPDKIETTTLPDEAPVKPAQGAPAAEPPKPKELAARSDVSPLPPFKTETQPVRTFPRYNYLNPPKPAAGKRTDAMPAFNEGLQAQRAGDAKKASAAYRKAVKTAPSFFEAHYNLSLIAAQNRQWDEALRESEMALAIKPDSIDARFNFALALQNAGYEPQAAAEFEHILKQNETDIRAQLSLANLYAQRLGQPEKAKPHYQKVIDLDPKHPQSLAIRYWLNEH